MTMITKSVKYSSKYLNANKLDIIKQIDSNVKDLKNVMSSYIHKNVYALFSNKSEFITNYRNFRYYDELSAWETQTIFQEICTKYQVSYDRLVKNLNLKVQNGDLVIQKYKRKTGNSEVGSVKSAKIKKRTSKYSSLIKYALYSEIDLLDNQLQGKEKLESLWLEVRDNPARLRAFSKLINTLKMGLFSRLKLIELKTGTHMKALKEASGKSNSSELIYDETNTQYKHWFKFKMPKHLNHIYIPLQINRGYHERKEFKADSQYLIKVVGNRVDIITTYKTNPPTFFDRIKNEGLDLNAKNNFAVISNHKTFDYDRQYINKVVTTLKKFDKIGINKLSETKKRQLAKLCRGNEWYFKKLVAEILTYCAEQSITDLTIEDLQLFNATFIRSTEFDIKYSKLVRLLRLSNIKNWMISQGEKYGIRVHTTPAAYTSKMCINCGSDDDRNRLTQELYDCKECGFTMNADEHAALRIKERESEDVLREKLHNLDDYGRLVAKDIGRDEVHKIMLRYHKQKEKLITII